jgi:uncharacterized membrane protein YebE (DUF533 family)
MSAQSFLDQLLKTGMSALGSAGQTARSNDMGKYATGAAVGGALGLLLGTRRGRSMGGKALKYGSMAAIGALAWKAYQDYQASQRAAAPAGAAGAPAGAAPAALPAPSFEALPAPQLEQHAQAMLKAMIAAAKSDGHMDERERELVGNELNRLQADAATRQWVDAEIRRPVDPADVARAATTPEQAAEVYLASVLVVDETTAMERAYLDQLAQALRLAPQLKADLEARAAAAG